MSDNTLLRPADVHLPLREKLPPLEKRRPQKVILIAGPTACGKTALSLLLARMLGGEIISADSMQVYRGMDIGTAKVSQEDQAQIPHHLIDIRDIHESFNIVDFYYEAKRCAEAILARGRVPIVVGGSGFYFRSFLYGPPSGPPSIETVRLSLEEHMATWGPLPLYQRLQELDPTYAQTITPNDRHKIVRALEIISVSGNKVSAHPWDCTQPLDDFDYHCWFIFRPRTVLYPAIDARCTRMLEAGLLDEIRALEKRGLRSNPSASQAIGYRQGLEYLASAQTPRDFEEFARTFKTASRQYAKRQFTFFKKWPPFQPLDVDVHDIEIAAERIAQEYLA